MIAADAASAVAYGFREVETTVPVLGDAPSNAVALLIGSQVGIPGAMAQCSIEEALELRLGLRGLTSYAETISLYGTEQVFVDGDDTPFSKAILTSLPVLLAGADFIFSGFGSIPRYDNAFALSNFNSDDMDDFLVLQRDWGVDGGLRTVAPAHLARVRRRAATAVQAVYRDLGLADFDDARVDAVLVANGSRDLSPGDPKAVAEAAAEIEAKQLNVFDVIASLKRTGYDEEADAIMHLTRERRRGDQLQTSAIFDADMRVLSKITDPNDYAGPGSGYALTAERRAEIDGIRQARTAAELTADQAEHRDHVRFTDVETARQGSDPREVCIGLSPVLGRTVWLSLCGLEIGEVLRQISAGLEEEGCVPRLVRVRSTIDVGLIGLTAARLSGSGIGIGLQGKGTALIHRRDLAPLANLELFSVAPLLTTQMYRELGKNAARHAKGMAPVPIFTGGTDESISARYHARAVALVALEREACEPGETPMTVAVQR